MRSWLDRHPGVGRISRFSDCELGRRGTARIRRHLLRCTRCRATLYRIREAERMLGEIPTPPAPPALLDAILERREADIRTILPDTAGLGRRPSGAGVLSAAAATVAAGILLASLVVGRLHADSARVRVGEPGPGGRSTIVYSPVSYLEHAGELRARVKAWYPDAREPVTFSEVLGRDGDAFSGTVSLPEGAVYGQLVIEDRYGTRIDAGQGHLWEVWARPAAERDARTLVIALRAAIALGREGFVSPADLRFRARALTEAYPASVEAWALRASLDRERPEDDAERQSALELDRTQLAAFLAAPGDPSDLRFLLNYARTLGETTAADDLARRLADEDPEAREVRDLEVARAQVRLADDPEAMLRLLEEEWEAHERPSSLAADLGFRHATDLMDAAAAVRWARRLFPLEPGLRDWISRSLASVPGAEAEAVSLLRSRLRDTDNGEGRPLSLSVEEFAGFRERRRSRLLGALGVALLRSGSPDEATDALEESLALGWDADVAITLVGHYRTEGIGGEPLLDLRAKLAVDPLASPDSPDDSELPAARLASAREELVRQLIAGRRSGPAPHEILEAMEDTPAALVAMWRVVPQLDQNMRDQFASAASRLRDAGGRALVAAPDDDAAELRAAAEGFTVLRDGGRAIESLRNWQARSYAVLSDGSYWLYDDLDDALRLALLLSSGAG